MIIKLLLLSLTNAISFDLDTGYYGRTSIDRDSIDVTVDDKEFINQLDLRFIGDKNIGEIITFECCEQELKEKRVEIVYYKHMLEDITEYISSDCQKINPSYLSCSRSRKGSTISFNSLEYFQCLDIYNILELDKGAIPEYVRQVFSRFIIFIDNNPSIDNFILNKRPDVHLEMFTRKLLFYNTCELCEDLYNDLNDIISYIRSNESISSDSVAFRLYETLYKRAFETYILEDVWLDSTNFENEKIIGTILLQIRDLHKAAKFICQEDYNRLEENAEIDSVNDVLRSLKRCIILEMSSDIYFDQTNTKIIIDGDLKEKFIAERIYDSYRHKIIIPCQQLLDCYSKTLKLGFFNGINRGIWIDIRGPVDNLKNFSH